MKSDNDIATEMGLIGLHGRIVGDHPWAGNGATIVRAESTFVGPGVVVRIDGETHESFIFDSKAHWRPDSVSPHPSATEGGQVKQRFRFAVGTVVTVTLITRTG